MANPVVNTAICTCSFGTVPMVLPVTSQQTVMMGGMPAATILDNKCTTFGMCSCLAHPAVAAATAAAFGALTPSACIPLTLTPWAPGVPTVSVGGKPLLNNTSKLMCSYGGVIQVTMTPAVTINTP